MWPRLASAFEVDRLLKRTFLQAIPVWHLHGIVSTRMFYISDLCVALVEFFPRGIITKEKVVRNDHLNVVQQHNILVLFSCLYASRNVLTGTK